MNDNYGFRMSSIAMDTGQVTEGQVESFHGEEQYPLFDTPAPVSEEQCEPYLGTAGAPGGTATQETSGGGMQSRNLPN